MIHVNLEKLEVVIRSKPVSSRHSFAVQGETPTLFWAVGPVSTQNLETLSSRWMHSFVRWLTPHVTRKKSEFVVIVFYNSLYP